MEITLLYHMYNLHKLFEFEILSLWFAISSVLSTAKHAGKQVTPYNSRRRCGCLNLEEPLLVLRPPERTKYFMRQHTEKNSNYGVLINKKIGARTSPGLRSADLCACRRSPKQWGRHRPESSLPSITSWAHLGRLLASPVTDSGARHSHAQCSHGLQRAPPVWA